MIKKYHKKSVEVTAVQWDGTEESYKEVCEFIGLVRVPGDPYPTETLQIDTLEGVMKASVGDYIIKGIKGEFYPCKPDIFKQTYIDPFGTPPEIIPAIDFKNTIYKNERNIIDNILHDINRNLGEIMNGSDYPRTLTYTQKYSSVLITDKSLDIVANILEKAGYEVRIDVDRQSDIPTLVIDLEKTVRG